MSHFQPGQTDLFDCTKSAPLPYSSCSWCTFESHFLIIHNIHVLKHSKGNIPEPKICSYTCRKCNFNTYSYLIYLRHSNSCLRKFRKTYNCNWCPYIAKQKCGLDSHILARHTAFSEINWLKCAHCTYKTKTKGDLTKHLKRIHFKESIQDEKKFQCEQCPFRTKRKPLLKKHVIVIHMNNNNSSDRDEKSKHSCKLCSYKTNRTDNLKSHVKFKHTEPENIKWFKCDKCEYKAKRSHRLKEHVLMKHTDLNEIKWYKCGHCTYKGKLKSNLKNHIMTKHINVGTGASENNNC